MASRYSAASVLQEKIRLIVSQEPVSMMSRRKNLRRHWWEQIIGFLPSTGQGSCGPEPGIITAAEVIGADGLRLIISLQDLMDAST